MKTKGWLIRFTLSLILMVIFLSCSNERMYAADGGEAPTQGEITLVGDSSEPPKPSGSSEAPKASDSSSGAPTPVKPKGKFPSTGELVKAGLSVGGLALIAAVFIFFFIKKGKAEHENDGGNK
ncbi:LPXTG cell wall anchor domain-containing protein [Candidatus Enterococcus mansonii]|uniref:Gram-positive cocci surface proteins LPxTG domain-containing protein n=1 Tax=Candidatus Enterococcus mansonii TaxID=1834181 RepID=A0A242CCB6_9ENTE|nr:LPXTG cell wall anchor domain-containing protein [Enterococcus sp. 4G2_DIV0659]OTO07836.1 hypothetical protein A5880_002106 [Enterococcus sp. 4G2_DIV0659]